ncbi:MAG TPA: SEC-C metal-binding domain-containing protein, partial [Vicinamibacteria bacterium]|nr:SEC-C metal-binding domain-containing protein [Vicinamibacteria bacterium]
SINFDHPNDIRGGRKLRKQARAQGWELAGPRAFPWIQHLAADGISLPIESDDYRRATASLRAITAFMEGHRSLFEGEGSDPVRETMTVRDVPGEVVVTVTAPFPDVRWQWGQESSTDGMRRTEAEGARDAFLAARRADFSEEEVLEAGSAVSELIEFGVFHAGEPLPRWTPDLVSEYLVEYYPRKGSVSGDEIDAIPGYLGAFFEWLGKSGQLPQTTATAIRRRIGRERASFLRAARDPARFGPAKAVVATMQREGVDIEDEAAVHRFLEDFNRRLEKDPELLPMPDLSRFLGPSKKWVWNGEGPAPDPVASCPCGSGRRYRKCCMPR